MQVLEKFINVSASRRRCRHLFHLFGAAANATDREAAAAGEKLSARHRRHDNVGTQLYF
jgi:hypothetical protein